MNTRVTLSLYEILILVFTFDRIKSHNRCYSRPKQICKTFCSVCSSCFFSNDESNDMYRKRHAVKVFNMPCFLLFYWLIFMRFDHNFFSLIFFLAKRPNTQTKKIVKTHTQKWRRYTIILLIGFWHKFFFRSFSLSLIQFYGLGQESLWISCDAIPNFIVSLAWVQSVKKIRFFDGNRTTDGILREESWAIRISPRTQINVLKTGARVVMGKNYFCPIQLEPNRNHIKPVLQVYLLQPKI